ncbi:hypothetical protein [Streptosporangium sp. KLBMP 9127]|nr:hypothetical protein [Streptosporangium sp. KLBMP 9127]
MFTSNRKARAAVLVGAALTVVGAAGVAGASIVAQPASSAPNAQVAGLINANGTIAHEKGVITITHPRTGVYCIRTEIPDVRRSIALVSSWHYGRIVSASTVPNPDCGSRIDTVRVAVTDHNRTTVNDSFTIAVP